MLTLRVRLSAVVTCRSNLCIHARAAHSPKEKEKGARGEERGDDDDDDNERSLLYVYAIIPYTLNT